MIIHAFALAPTLLIVAPQSPVVSEPSIQQQVQERLEEMGDERLIVLNAGDGPPIDAAIVPVPDRSGAIDVTVIPRINEGMFQRVEAGLHTLRWSATTERDILEFEFDPDIPPVPVTRTAWTVSATGFVPEGALSDQRTDRQRADLENALRNTRVAIDRDDDGRAVSWTTENTGSSTDHLHIGRCFHWSRLSTIDAPEHAGVGTSWRERTHEFDDLFAQVVADYTIVDVNDTELVLEFELMVWGDAEQQPEGAANHHMHRHETPLSSEAHAFGTLVINRALGSPTSGHMSIASATRFASADSDEVRTERRACDIEIAPASDEPLGQRLEGPPEPSPDDWP